MDDEREIDETSTGERELHDLVERSKLTFLRGILDEFQRKQAQYDIGSEFAKTRSNRTPLVPLLVLALVAIFLAGSVGVTRYIQAQTRSIDVGISDDFRDIALRDVLDGAKRLENEMERALGARSSAERARDEELAAIQRAASREIELLALLAVEDEERARRRTGIEADARERSASVEEEFARQLQSIDGEIESIEDRMQQYDTRQLDLAREQEEILDNQRRLFELQMAEQRQDYEESLSDLTSDYEARISELESFTNELESQLTRKHAEEIAALIRLYNPDLSDEEIGPLLGSATTGSAPPGDTNAGAGAVGSKTEQPAATPTDMSPSVHVEPGLSEPYDAYLRHAAGFGAGDFRELSRTIGEANRILRRLQGIPYEGSVPEALAGIDARYRRSVREMEIVLAALLETVRRRDSTIAAREADIEALRNEREQFRFALDSLTATNRENGYVIDPRDLDAIYLHIDRIREPVRGTVGYVFREDDEFIGTIVLNASAGGVVGRLLSIEPGNEIRPFDKVLIQIRDGG